PPRRAYAAGCAAGYPASPAPPLAPTSAIPARASERALDPRHAQLEVFVPLQTPALAHFDVLGMVLPRLDRLFVFPVAHGDAESVGATHSLDSQEPRLSTSQLHHPLGGLGIALVRLASLGGEDHREVRRLGGLRETLEAHRLILARQPARGRNELFKFAPRSARGQG